MQKFIESCVEAARNSRIVVIGDTHTLPEHDLARIQIVEALAGYGFKDIFLELNYFHQNKLASIAAQPLTESLCNDYFSQTAIQKTYTEHYSHPKADTPEFLRKTLSYESRPDFNFIPGLSGNKVAFHQLISAASRFGVLHAMDCTLNYMMVDPVIKKFSEDTNTPIPMATDTDLEGIDFRNRFMTGNVIQNSHGKAIVFVGGAHLYTVKKNKKTSESIQSMLGQYYGAENVTAIRLCDFQLCLYEENKAMFEAAQPLFRNTKPELLITKDKSLLSPNYLGIFPEINLYWNDDKFMRNDHMTRIQAYKNEKAHWNVVCEQHNQKHLKVA